MAYRESPTVGVHMAHGVEKRSIDGVPTDVAEVWFNVEPMVVSDGFRFVSEVDEFVLPERFVEAAGTGALHRLPHHEHPFLGPGFLGGRDLLVLRLPVLSYWALFESFDSEVYRSAATIRAALPELVTAYLGYWAWSHRELIDHLPRDRSNIHVSDRENIVVKRVSGRFGNIPFQCVRNSNELLIRHPMARREHQHVVRDLLGVLQVLVGHFYSFRPSPSLPIIFSIFIVLF